VVRTVKKIILFCLVLSSFSSFSQVDIEKAWVENFVTRIEIVFQNIDKKFTRDYVERIGSYGGLSPAKVDEFKEQFIRRHFSSGRLETKLVIAQANATADTIAQNITYFLKNADSGLTDEYLSDPDNLKRAIASFVERNRDDLIDLKVIEQRMKQIEKKGVETLDNALRFADYHALSDQTIEKLKRIKSMLISEERLGSLFNNAESALALLKKSVMRRVTTLAELSQSGIGDNVARRLLELIARQFGVKI
jgi:hypothetical protein